ncbi:transcription initiation factor TFIID subunit 8-like protein [Cricetulus griseus]|uniref:Transcription initiation factor TFIID subunit 8 n=1 Tax=Cricetulus griseus TaxID=10029 RepID=A0A061IJM4_CRIGR|nr:transcription initiation factor TFIID subunit 8-like protein [Cricetulus griseus]
MRSRLLRLELTSLGRAPVTNQPVTPKALTAGQNRPHPPHIPSHFPEFPDPHTYIKTPGFSVALEPVLELGKQRQADLCEFKASLIYRGDSGAEKENASVLQQNSSLSGSRNGEENVIDNPYLRPVKKPKIRRKKSLS